MLAPSEARAAHSTIGYCIARELRDGAADGIGDLDDLGHLRRTVTAQDPIQRRLRIPVRSANARWESPAAVRALSIAALTSIAITNHLLNQFL